MDPTKFTLRRSAFSPANAIFIVDCLSEEDLQTGRSRLNAMHNLLNSRDPEQYEHNKKFVNRFEASSAADFNACFEVITAACERGIVPIIFIDAHGDAAAGLRMPSEEFIGWEEMLSCFDRVIQRTAGELTVIVAACHSMSAVKNMSLERRLPFAFYYGYPSRVWDNELAQETDIIYKSLFNDGGKSVLSAKNLELRSFSEYDHIELTLGSALLMAKSPDILDEMVPGMSRAKLLSEFEQEAEKQGVPLSEAREKFNKMLDSGIHAITLVKKMMHDTPRLERIVQDIKVYIQGSPFI